MGIGKWILTGLGWALGGPIGGMIGYFLGDELSRAFKSNDSPRIEGPRTNYRRGPYHNTGTAGDLHAALLVLIAAVMKSDGVVKRSELDYVKRFLLANYSEDEAREMLLVLRELVNKDIPIGDVCIQIKHNTDYDTRYHMLDFLAGLAEADGDFAAREYNVLRLIATGLGINTRDFASIYARHSSASQQSSGGYSYGSSSHSSSSSSSSSRIAHDPYKVLGIESSATDLEVKKAYRRLAMKYHPDKVEGLGEEVKRNAVKQFREIQEAYETICKSRQIK